MIYLLSTLAAAVGLAIAGIVTETSTKYFARYVIENESGDLGASVAGAPEPAHVAAAVEEAGTTVGQVGRPVPILAQALKAAPLAAAPPSGATQPYPTEASGASAPAPSSEVAAVGYDPASVEPVEKAPSEAILSLVRDTPHRRPDGTVFLPVATQRLFAMRWQVARQRSVARSFEIPGRVTTDPSTETGIYAARVGVLESVDGRFPYLGMRVRKGDLLAYLRPVWGTGERAQLEAQMAELANQISLAEKQIARLKEVLFIRYRENKIEALRVEIEGHRRQIAVLREALDGREPLRAEADGVISGIHATAGTVVAQNAPVFDIVDPGRLWVEAAAYDPAVARDVAGASARTADGRTWQLEFVGGGLTLDNQAIPLRFRILGPAEELAVGNPVTVVVQSRERVEGVPLPGSSLVRDADGRNLVWERLSAEVFRPHYVEAVKLAGNDVVLRSDLPSGLRIVTAGASILSQVR